MLISSFKTQVGVAYDPYKSDIWALGVTLYCMLFGKVPFGSKMEGGIVGILESIRTEVLLFPFPVSKDCQHLLSLMLERNPKVRISLQEIKNHPWLQLQSRLRGKSYPPPAPVEVSVEEINLAFTPVNNLILMVRCTCLIIRFLVKVNMM